VPPSSSAAPPRGLVGVGLYLSAHRQNAILSITGEAKPHEGLACPFAPQDAEAKPGRPRIGDARTEGHGGGGIRHTPTWCSPTPVVVRFARERSCRRRRGGTPVGGINVVAGVPPSPCRLPLPWTPYATSTSPRPTRHGQTPAGLSVAPSATSRPHCAARPPGPTLGRLYPDPRKEVPHVRRFARYHLE